MMFEIEKTKDYTVSTLMQEIKNTRLGALCKGDPSQMADFLSVLAIEMEEPSGLTVQELLALQNRVFREVIMCGCAAFTTVDLMDGILGRVPAPKIRALLAMEPEYSYSSTTLFQRIALDAARADRASYENDYDSFQADLERALDQLGGQKGA